MKTRASLAAVLISLIFSACDSDNPPSAEAAPTAASAAAAPDSTPADAGPVASATGEPAPAAAVASPDADKAVSDAIDSNLGDHQRYRDVIDALQSAVGAGDAARVASLVEYPISVDIGGKETILKDEKEFAARYSDFMTADISTAITGTRYSDLFVNYKGVMFGSGQAWINGICKDSGCKEFDVKVVALQHGPQ
jgi:hypothetical protein